MKNRNKIELVGTIKNVHVQRCNGRQRTKLRVETEDWDEDIGLQLPVTVWENEDKRNLKLPTIGSTVHIVGRVRVKNQTIAYRKEKTIRDIVAYKVEIIDTK